MSASWPSSTANGSILHLWPEFERMLVRSGVILLKYWLSVGAEEQELRFQGRAKNPLKRWKLSDMDIESRDMWVEYSKAKDEAFLYTDIPAVPRTRSRPMTSAGCGSTASATFSTRFLTSM